MKYFHGANRRSPYFEGWYLKHQSRQGKLLALIPAFHIDSAGQRSASLQIISDHGSWWLEYPDGKFSASEKQFRVRLGDSCFDRQGIQLHVNRNGLSLHGALRYGPFTPIRSDIMGPFRLIAGMECAHGVISMGHLLEGTIILNGEVLDFSGGTGYIETDRGRSFPDVYLWSQCVWQEPQNGSLMLAVASIPMPVGRFTGCICAILCQGQEYRLATYLGARVESWSQSGAVLRQGKYRLSAELLAGDAQPLRAPAEGRMERTIHESLRASMRYRFWSSGTLLFEHTDLYAGFEYADAKQCGDILN